MRACASVGARVSAGHLIDGLKFLWCERHVVIDDVHARARPQRKADKAFEKPELGLKDSSAAVRHVRKVQHGEAIFASII